MIMSMKSKWLVNKGICLYLLLDFTYYQNTVEPILSKKVGNMVYISDMRGFGYEGLQSSDFQHTKFVRFLVSYTFLKHADSCYIKRNAIV